MTPPSEHSAGCSCTRCVGFEQGNELGRRFEPGNDLGLRHGAYVSPVKLAARAQEIADVIRPSLPVYSSAFEATLCSYAIVLVRIERASAACDAVEAAADEAGARPAGLYLGKAAEPLSRLRADLRAWIGLSLKLAGELGLTPAGAARLARDVGAGLSAQEALRRHLVERYGSEVES